MGSGRESKDGEEGSTPPDYDAILDQVGEFGRWQKFLFFLMCIPSATSAMAVFMYSFIAYEPLHRCKVDSCNDTVYQPGPTSQGWLNITFPVEDGQWDQCQSYKYNTDKNTCPPSGLDHSARMDCPSGYVYDTSLFPSTAVTEINMVCSDNWMSNFAQSIYMAGMLVGSFVFGLMADRFGRLLTLVASATVLAGAGTLSAILPASMPLFTTLRFFSGMGHVGTFIICFTLSVEYVGAKSRVFTGSLIEVPFSIGGLIVGFLAWGGVRNWRTLQLICSAPCILMVAFWWICPESPRWLIAKGRYAQLEKDVRKTARINRTDFPDGAFQMTKAAAEVVTEKSSEAAVASKDSEVNQVEEGKEANFLDLFRPFPIARRTLAMFYNWMVATICYYGLTQLASSLSDDVFLNYTLLILVEVPANVLAYFLMDKVGRKPILAGCQILSGLACVVAGFLGSGWLQVALSLIGKFGATGSFNIVFVYTAEMFPTEIRSTAVGTSSTCARIGGILAPQVAFLGTVWKPLPLLVFGSSALIGGAFALLFLPETLGYPLPETMEDALALGSPKDKKEKSRLVVNASSE